MRVAERIARVVGAMVLAGALSACSTPPSRARLPRPEALPATVAAPAPEVSVEPTSATDSVKVLPPETGAWVGVFTPPVPFKPQAVEEYVSLAGAPPAIVMWYQPWAKDGADEFLGEECVEIMRKGMTPLITWEPWDPSADPDYLKHPEKQPRYRLSKIADGSYDRYIRGWAKEIRELGGPVMLRPMHEMNGTWYPWGGTVNGNSPEDYISAWRHIRDVFADEGADNVTWVWSVNNNSIPDEPGNRYGDYYPGDEYVDWVGSSGFNWGASRARHQWKSFDDVFGEAYVYLRTLDKPILIAEFATVSKGGSKANWILDAYRSIRKDYPGVGAVVYYDAGEEGLKGKQDWGIASVKGSATAYAEAVSDPHFRHAPVTALEEWSREMSDSDWDALTRRMK